MLYEILAALAALAFFILVIYLVKTLISLKQSLEKTNQILGKIETKVDPLTEDIAKLIQNSNHLIQSVRVQLENFDPLLNSISNAGKVFQRITHPLADKPQYRIKLVKEEKSEGGWANQLVNILELAQEGVKIWQKTQKRG